MALKPPPKKPSAPTTATPPGPGAASTPKLPPTKAPPPKAAPAASSAAPSAPAAQKPPAQKPAAQKTPTQQPAAQKSSPKQAPAQQVLRRQAAPAATADPGAPIEEQVFSALGVASAQDLPDSELFAEFIETLAPKLALPHMSRAILDAFSSLDVTAEKLAHCIQTNQYYEQLFLRHIEAMAKRENAPKIEGAIILLGMQNSRNMVLALQMLRTVRGSYPEVDKDGKLKVTPNDMVKFALKAEESVPKDRYVFADTAFAAGLLFDWLMLIAGEIAKDKKKAQSYVEAQFLHGLKTAQIAMEICKTLPDFSFKKYVFGAALIHDVGKIAAAILKPEFLSFNEDASKHSLSRELRFFAEGKRNDINHAYLGGMICHYFRIFRPIEKAVVYHHEPYKLKEQNKNLFQLSSLICLATNVANNFRKTEKIDDPVLQLWRGPELKDFKLDVRELMKSVSRVV